jgi:zinc transport system substrate-binding protein
MVFVSSRGLAALSLAVVLIAISGIARAAEPAPRVVVSIPPVHALVARVMAGVGTPDLLIPGQVSPHSFALRPSDARRLAAADLIVWVGPGLETSLPGPLAALAGGARQLAVIDAPGIEHLAVREGGVWGAHEHEAAEAPEHDHDRHGDGEIDAHIWLDTGNAHAIVAAVADALIAVDPDHVAIYAVNRDAAQAELAALTEELRARLAPVRDRPFVVLHDAYQYFEHQFDLTAVGAIVVTPDIRAGARRLVELRTEIRARNARCIFAEPQVALGQMQAVAEGTGARIGTLDPIGAALTPGPELYPQMMRDLAAGVVDCLAAEG